MSLGIMLLHKCCRLHYLQRHNTSARGGNKLPLEDEKLKELQQKDKFCKEVMEKLSKGQLQSGQPYYQEEGIFKRFVKYGKQRFEAVVLPQVLIGEVLQLAHEGLGHNGSPRTYALIKRYYYWKGLKSMVKKHVMPGT